MDKDFEVELRGSSIEAAAAKQQIAKYFQRYAESGYEEAKRNQLMFASKIICAISKCGNKHSEVYCSIIVDVFANELCPSGSEKYWTYYINGIRYYHYILVEKKEFEKASLIYRHIVSYNNKLQNAENSLTCINIYCYQLFLQNSLKSKNQKQAISEATDVLENMARLFKDILETNRKQNFQYPDILRKTWLFLFPQKRVGTIYQFLKILPAEKVKEMFHCLFTLHTQQIIFTNFNEVDVQDHAKFIMEAIYTLLKVDIFDKMQLQLSVHLLDHCRNDCRLQTNKPIAELLHSLYDYLTLLISQKDTLDFHYNYNTCCECFKGLFEKYSKSVMNQLWFGDFLIIIFYLHSELQNQTIFSCFWKQMLKPACFKAMFHFFMEVMKVAPCISTESKLLTMNCCTSIRKHVILSFAQIALTAFVFYCQNVTAEDEEMEWLDRNYSQSTHSYKEMIENNVLMIVNHAFKIIDKMDCITSSSQEIDIIITRFKQITLSCKTSKQAGTCISICELFLKIKTKVSSNEWTLILRRLYKTVTQLKADAPHIGRVIQMCYITSMLHDSIRQIDINQIRTQIGIFYAIGTASVDKSEEEQPHEHCLLHLHYTENSFLKSHLDITRRKLLHWLESQHILKYFKTNTTLLHSIIKYSQSHYDFVLIAKLGKLQTYAMAKISSIYKSLTAKKKSLVPLSRLELLTLAHVCVILLNEMAASQKILLDSKDFSEDQLENLFTREEMSSITISNDLKRFKLAWEGFKAFEDFYEKFDNESITMDDAIVDWESLLDDLGALALQFQLSGYIEQSSKAWLLYYKCSRLLQNDISALRALSFFCEYSEIHETNLDKNKFQLEEEIQQNFPALIQNLENFGGMQRQAHQVSLLLTVLQIAHYYARSLRFSFAQMLFHYVVQKHAELTGRQEGGYDIVLATMDAIKFRLLWKNLYDVNSIVEENTLRTTSEKLLLHRCLLHEIEEMLDGFHDFIYISSSDGILYSILIINLVLELAECCINRLCDNFINSFFIAACKCTLMLGLSLRFVQVMSMWMGTNLQMEYVDKAQVKLKIIEYIMDMKSFTELNEECKKSPIAIQSWSLLPEGCGELLTPSHHNAAMETIRKVAPVQLSPIKTNKLQLSSSIRNVDLKRYFNCNIDVKLLPQNEQIEWTFFMIGCLNARLFFLVEDYDQLETFYETSNQWLQNRQNAFNKRYYKNIQLMAMQHYANFLRSRCQYDKALKCLEYGIDLCVNHNFYTDAVYYVNFKLQLAATLKEIGHSKNVNSELPTHNKLRRALQFNLPQESAYTEAKNVPKANIYNVVASGHKVLEIGKPTPTIGINIGCSSSKKIKTRSGVDVSDSNSSCGSSSSLDLKSTKPKPKFKIREDSIDIVEIIDNDCVIAVNNAIPVKRTDLLEDNAQMYKTPKVHRKTAKLAKSTCGKISARYKRPAQIPKFHIDTNLDNIPSFSPAKLSTSLSESVDSKEMIHTIDLVTQMRHLDVKSSRTGNKLLKEADVIVLEDSPVAENSNQTRLGCKGKSHKTCIKTEDKSPNICEDNLQTSTRTRRQKKIMCHINDIPNAENKPPSSCAATPKTMVTRSRQKKLL